MWEDPLYCLWELGPQHCSLEKTECLCVVSEGGVEEKEKEDDMVA